MAEITVDDRFYTISGKKYPRMTKVMEVMPRGWLDKWKQKIGVEKARQIAESTAESGTMIHAMTALSDLKKEIELMWMLDREPWLLPYLFSWQSYRDKYIEKVIWVERTVWSDRLKVAGTTDRLILYKGDFYTSILDLKSTRALSDEMGVQLRGYLEMTIERLIAMGAPEWMMPKRTVIAHMPGPREDDEEVGWVFPGIKIKEYPHEKYAEELEACITQYYALTT